MEGTPPDTSVTSAADDGEQLKGENAKSFEEEELEYVEERILTRDEVGEKLSWLGKAAAADGYAYLKVSLADMALTNIEAITGFKHLQYVDLSRNFITSEALQVMTRLPVLLSLQVDENRLPTPYLDRCTFLQVIIMDKNAISSVYEVYHPELSTFQAAHNYIEYIDFQYEMPSLKVLDLAHNYIADLGVINFFNLDSLYMASNKLKSLEGLSELKNLRIVHLRNNPLRVLNGFEEPLPRLKYVNLRCCKIGTLKQIKKLRKQKTLETLVLKGTPYMGGTGDEEEELPEEDDSETRIETLAALAFLQRLNKFTFTDEERQEAKALATQWAEEGDEDEEEEAGEEFGEVAPEEAED